MDNVVVGSIRKGKHTVGHASWLKAHGYEVQDGEKFVIVSGASFVESEVDLSGEDAGKATLQQAIKDRKLFTYQTPFKFPDGKILRSVMACTRLGHASALIVKPKSNPSVPNPYDNI